MQRVLIITGSVITFKNVIKAYTILKGKEMRHVGKQITEKDGQHKLFISCSKLSQNSFLTGGYWPG